MTVQARLGELGSVMQRLQNEYCFQSLFYPLLLPVQAFPLWSPCLELVKGEALYSAKRQHMLTYKIYGDIRS